MPLGQSPETLNSNLLDDLYQLWLFHREAVPQDWLCCHSESTSSLLAFTCFSPKIHASVSRAMTMFPSMLHGKMCLCCCVPLQLILIDIPMCEHPTVYSPALQRAGIFQSPGSCSSQQCFFIILIHGLPYLDPGVQVYSFHIPPLRMIMFTLVFFF